MTNCCDGQSGMMSGIAECIASALDCVNKSLGCDMFPYRAFVIIATWSGANVGEGMPTVSEYEITPRPSIEDVGDVSIEVDDEGRYESGGAMMRVSTSFPAEKLNPELLRNQEFWYDIVDQAGKRRRFFPASAIMKEPMAVTYDISIRRLRSDSLDDGTIHDEIPMFIPRA